MFFGGQNAKVISQEGKEKQYVGKASRFFMTVSKVESLSTVWIY